jgi:hypothetical protein
MSKGVTKDGAGQKINTFFTCGVGGPEAALVVG